MTVEYDVDIKKPKHLFWNFVESGRENVKITYDSVEEAKDAAKKMCDIRRYKSLMDEIGIMRDGKVLWLVRKR